MEYTLKVMKTDRSAIIPSKSYDTDSGFDLYLLNDENFAPGEVRVLRTGIAAEITEGWALQLRSRSSTLIKYNVHIEHGTIDNSYRGEIQIIAQYNGLGIKTIPAGTRIAQIVPEYTGYGNLVVVCELSETKRGEKGIGSSGK